MPQFLFLGAEDHDFQAYGVVDVSTDARRFRPAFARCALGMRPAAPNWTAPGAGWRARFAAASADLWVSGRHRAEGDPAGNQSWAPMLTLFAGEQPLLGLQRRGTMGLLRFVRHEANGAVQPLGPEGGSIPADPLVRVDAQVRFGADGRLRCFLDGVGVLEWAGDLSMLPGGAAAAADNCFFRAGSGSEYATHWWSECVAAERDTRTLHLKTLAVEALGATAEWAGTAADVSEVRCDDTTANHAAEPDKAQGYAVSGMPAGTFAVRAVGISARAARAPSGPAAVQLGVRTNGADAYAPAAALDTGWARVSHTMDFNPATGARWTPAEVEALQLLAKSKA